MTAWRTHALRTAACGVLVLGGLMPALAGCGPEQVVCSYAEDTANPSGLTISHGFVTAHLHVFCTSEPDTYSLVMILVRDKQMLEPGSHYTDPPAPAGYDATTFAPCTPGSWYLYYSVTATYQGQVAHNTTPTLPSREIVLDDC